MFPHVAPTVFNISVFSEFLVKEIWSESCFIWSDGIFRQIWLTDLTERAAGANTATHTWSEGPTPVCYLERFYTFMHIISQGKKQPQPRADSMQPCKLPQNVKMPRVGIEDYTEIKEMQMIHLPATLSWSVADGLLSFNIQLYLHIISTWSSYQLIWHF